MAVTTSWHMEVGNDSRIYLMKGEEKMKAEGNYKDGRRPYIGPITDVRHHSKSDKTYLLVWKILFSSSLLFSSSFVSFPQFQTVKDTVRPRPLFANNFNASANELCELFQRAGSASHFTHIWKTTVRPYLTSDGYFYRDSANGKAPLFVY